MGKRIGTETNAAEDSAKETAEDVAERLKTEQARLFAPLILEVYQNRRNTLPQEVIEDIEKYLVGYWDRKTTSVKYKDRFKKNKTATAPTATAPTEPPAAS